MQGPAGSWDTLPVGLLHRALGLSLAISGLLLGVYGLIYSGVPTSDDEQLFASTAETLILDGRLAAPQMFGNARMNGEFDGTGILHPMLSALPISLANSIGVGRLQIAFSLTALYCALTSGVVVALGIVLGYSASAAASAGLILGLCTIVLPYSTSFFREPLAMLLLAVSWLAFEWVARYYVVGWKRHLAWGIFTVALAGAVMTKIMLLVALPAFFVLASRYRLSSRIRGRLRHWMMGAVGLVVLLWLATSLIPEGVSGPYFRLTGAFLAVVVDRIMSIGLLPAFRAFLGALASPGKGLLVYSPVFLAIPLAFRHKRTLIQNPWVLIPLTTLIGLLLAQGLAYGDQWPNTSWGTRFLLPAFPLLAVMLLPSLEAAFAPHGILTRFIIGLLSVFGLVIQVPAVLLNVPRQNAIWASMEHGVNVNESAWTLSHFPPIALLREIGAPATWRPALFHLTGPAMTSHILVLVCCGAPIVVGLVWLLRIHPSGTIYARRTMIPLIVLLFGLISLLIATATARGDARYGSQRYDFEQATVYVCTLEKPGDIIVVQPYPSMLWSYFMNWGCLKHAFISLPSNSVLENPESATSNLVLRTRELIEGLRLGDHRLIFIQDFYSQGQGEELAQSLIRSRSTLIAERTFPTGGSLRVSIFQGLRPK